jgi:2-polyprenyl-3-methyl-5-hydroxy-6-metoxy-1,4-benzoquinol methylase
MSILTNRLKYVLSPQADIYKQVSEITSGWVADVGCGLGFGGNLLVKRAKLVCGYDTDSEYLDFAKWCFPGVRFLKHDIVEAPLPYVYDHILMIDVIEHIEQDKQAVKHASMSLKESGSLVISTPNRLSRYRKSDNHIREYSPKELEEILRSQFKNVRLTSYGWSNIQSNYENPIIAICKKEN